MRRTPVSLAAASIGYAQQSAFDPAGVNASAIHRLNVFLVILLGAIFLIVIALYMAAILRRHRGIEQEPLERTHRPSPETERRMGRFVGTATLASLLIIFGLVVLSLAVSKATSRSPRRKTDLVIDVVGNQWWWFVRYDNADASRIIVAANEIHIPVGRQVMIRGTSQDVIHSFWVPNLQGKRDLIPSRTTTQWLEADRPGRYRGQCAEFCGLQHAKMAFWVIAEEPDRFETWYSQQLKPAELPTDPAQLHGQQVFLNAACVLCHTIQGTPAAGQVGPDLTHFAGRRSIAAGTLPNNKGNLGGWITDPQLIKPGTHMATVPVKAEDLEPLLDYLESLK